MLNKKLISLLKKNKKNISKLKIICIGDIILDHYVVGNVERISPEAPVKILSLKNEKYEIGGVGNVAKNIVNLGGKTSLLCLSGVDHSSKIIRQLLGKEKNINNILIQIPNFRTPRKTRFLEDSNHLLRVDDERINFKLKNNFKQSILKKLDNIIKKKDLIILSDYNKGLLDKQLIGLIIKISKKHNKKIIADPKKFDLSIYSNVDTITPNQKEMMDATGIKVLNEKNLIKSGKYIIQKYKISNLLITRSEKGMLLINRDGIKKFKSNPKKVIDVTGAGDTVLAVMGLMLALKLSFNESVEISNYAAGKVVELSGTACLNFKDLIN
tara:strand:- start:492 stop:1469 length:978 start_codon:yes stop_codon:yes gene_type:complete